MTHEPEGATVLPHVFDCENELGFVPPIVMPWIVNAELPLFVRATVCGAGKFLCFTKPTSIGTSSTLPAVSCTRAIADLVWSTTEVAVRVTVSFAGSAPGAVYVPAAPFAVSSGTTEPHELQGWPFCVILQETPLDRLEVGSA